MHCTGVCKFYLGRDRLHLGFQKYWQGFISLFVSVNGLTAYKKLPLGQFPKQKMKRSSAVQQTVCRYFLWECMFRKPTYRKTCYSCDYLIFLNSLCVLSLVFIFGFVRFSIASGQSLGRYGKHLNCSPVNGINFLIFWSGPHKFQ